MEVKVTTLIENTPDDKNLLLYEHGLSLYIEVGDTRILFDTGQSGDFIENAKALNISLDHLDYVIISHGHYDHSGGLKKLSKEYQIPTLIVGEEFFQPKYKVDMNDEYHYNGISFDEDYLIKHQIPLRKVKEEVTYLSNQIVIFHHFSKSNEFEKRKKQLVVKQSTGFVVDEFKDEIVLGIVTERGLVVLAGCSHAGIVNILTSITERTKLPICAVIGGTHLVDASIERLEKTVEAFQVLKIPFIAVSHCTGETGIKMIKDAYKEQFVYNNTGCVMTL